MTRLSDVSEHRELVNSFTRAAESLFPVARLHEAENQEIKRWSRMAELGWMGISLPEEVGGIALTAVEEVLAAQTFGHYLLPPAFIATVIAAHAFLKAGQADITSELVSGAKKAALGAPCMEGTSLYFDTVDAEFLLLLSPTGVRIYNRPAGEALDSTHWALPIQRIPLTNCLLELYSPALAAFAELLIAGTLAGIATATCDMGVEYAKIREQFGQPIGAFQAVKHHCANMAIAAYAARELVTHAAMALVDDDPEAITLAHAALSFAVRAARNNSGTNIQVHGGMGFSDECSAHLFLKYTHLLESACGGIGSIRARLQNKVPSAR